MCRTGGEIKHLKTRTGTYGVQAPSLPCGPDSVWGAAGHGVTVRAGGSLAAASSGLTLSSTPKWMPVEELVGGCPGGEGSQAKDLLVEPERKGR